MEEKFNSAQTLAERQARIAREKILYLYSTILEQGDVAAAFSILEQAQADPMLKKQLDEISEVYYEEVLQQARDKETKLVAELAAQYLPSAKEAVELAEMELPSLTLGDVMARLQADAAVTGLARNELSQIKMQLAQPDLPLPENLGFGELKKLFSSLKISASDLFLKRFREKAIMLSMSREQTLVQLAAARKQRNNSKPRKGEPK